MEVGPPSSPDKRRIQTDVVSCRSRAGVGSDYGKRLADERVRYVMGRRTRVNHCLRIESFSDGVETRAGVVPWDEGAPAGACCEPRGYLYAASVVPGVKVA